MGLVTVFCPLTTADTGETIFQPAGETRLVVDCKVNVSPAVLVGQIKTTLAAERLIVSWGCGNVMLNTVPAPFVPPRTAVPYRVLPDMVKLPYGEPEVAVKLYKVVKLVPSVLTANTVPASELPPNAAVPYRALPDNINSPHM